jgi:hypothetical protein
LEKREEKDCILENAGDRETGDLVDQGGEWGFIAYLHCLMVGDAFQMQTGVS